MITNPHMLPKVRSELIMQAAKSMPCALRISSLAPGHKCASQETNVMCHLPVHGKGTSTKVTDLATAVGCAHCHDILDGRDIKRQEYITTKFPIAFGERLLSGLVETHQRLVLEAIIFVRDGEIH